MALSQGVVILLVIVGCVVSVMLGYSIHFLATNGFQEDVKKDMGNEQRQYMRQLRMKQLSWMAREARSQRYDVETPIGSGVYSRAE